MDQMTIDDVGVFPTSTPAMVEELQTKITELEKKIKTLTEVIESHQYTNRMYEGQIDQFMTSLLLFYTNGEIDEEHAEVLADCFGRNLSRTVDVNFAIYGSMQLTIPADVNIDDLADEFNISILPSYSSEVMLEWDDIHSIEIEEA